LSLNITNIYFSNESNVIELISIV